MLSRLGSTRIGVDVIIPPETSFADRELLLPMQDCWNSLHLTCTPSSPSWVAFTRLAPGLSQLGNLTLDMDAEDPVRAARINLASLLPNLHTLHVIDIPSSIIWSPLTSKLVNLQFDVVISDRGLRVIFAQCTALESLSINLVVSNEEGSFETGGWRNEPLITPPSLRSLAFHQISSRYLCHVVKYLRAPTLENLVLCTMYGSFPGSACAVNAQSSTYYQFVSLCLSLCRARRGVPESHVTVTLHCLQIANLPRLERFTVRCVAALLRALLKGIIHAVSTTPDPACTLPPIVCCEMVPTMRFRNAPRELCLLNLSELSVTATKHDGPGILPGRSSVIRHEAIKEDLRALLRKLSLRNGYGLEHREGSRRVLRSLKLSGCDLEEDEIRELQSYTWDLKIEAPP